jgi:hypothetical protein
MRDRMGVVIALAALLKCLDAQAALLLHEDFSSYQDGKLVGQFGWSEFGTVQSPSLLIAGGQVVLPYTPAPAGTFTDGESAAKPIGAEISVPAAGSASIYLGTSIAVDAVDATTSANSRGVSLVDVNGFNDARLQIRAGTIPGMFQFGIQITGQTAAVFGGDLPLGQPYLVVTRLDLVAGDKNDMASLYIDPAGPDVPANAYVSSGSQVADPNNITGVSINQFYTGSQPGSRIDFVNVAAGNGSADFAAVIPEPSGLAFTAILGVTVAMKRKRDVQSGAD